MSEKAKGSTFPTEGSCRRVGWSEGDSLILGDGNRWHFPRIDHGLIPSLPRLVALGEPLNFELFGGVYLGEPSPGGIGNRITEFVRVLIELQYDLPSEMINDLVEDTAEADCLDMVEAVDHFLDALITFATVEVPTVATSADSRVWPLSN